MVRRLVLKESTNPEVVAATSVAVRYDKATLRQVRDILRHLRHRHAFVVREEFGLDPLRPVLEATLPISEEPKAFETETVSEREAREVLVLKEARFE